LHPTKNTRRILLVAAKDDLGALIPEVLEDAGFEVTVVQPFGKSGEILDELSRKEYSMVLLTNNFLRPEDILKLVPEIKRQYQRLKVVVMSGYRSEEFEKTLERYGIEAFVPLPFGLNSSLSD
jgi:DNA-binding NtrC family response regulator